jgi:hypothetical protein
MVLLLACNKNACRSSSVLIKHTAFTHSYGNETRFYDTSRSQQRLQALRFEVLGSLLESIEAIGSVYDVNYFFTLALGYGQDDRGSRIRCPAEAGNFSLHHRVQNGSGAHPASYPLGTRCFFPGGTAAGV